VTTPEQPRPAARRPRGGRVVISSVTGEPIPWEEDETEAAPAPGGDSNDARLAGDVPPHWGRGR
jgi:hypothetical protein